MKQQAKGNFITRDYRYVYLGGSLIALLCLSMLASPAHPGSFLTDGGVLTLACRVVCWAFLALSGFALMVKMAYWKTYAGTVLRRPLMLRVGRWASYLVVLA